MAARAELPSAFETLERLRAVMRAGELYLFFDYDGTLTPIVERPENAVLSERMRERLAALAEQAFVAVISGRGLDDLKGRVGLESLAYAGSHGFELVEPDGRLVERPEAQAAIPALDAAEAQLAATAGTIRGVQLERKRFGLAVHYRRVAEDRLPELQRAIETALEAQGVRLALKSGKKVWEFVPAIDWHKGHALSWILEREIGPNQAVLAVYIGDDVTDEDAFKVVADSGLAVAVGDGPAETAATHRLEDVDAVGDFLSRLTRKEA